MWTPSQRDCVEWLRALGAEDGMVDSFAVLRPSAVHRFTCWEQYRNQRYNNCGRRLDYLILDAPLFALARAGGPLAFVGSIASDVDMRCHTAASQPAPPASPPAAPPRST